MPNLIKDNIFQNSKLENAIDALALGYTLVWCHKFYFGVSYHKNSVFCLVPKLWCAPSQDTNVPKLVQD